MTLGRVVRYVCVGVPSWGDIKQKVEPGSAEEICSDCVSVLDFV